jgi:cytochrome c5
MSSQKLIWILGLAGAVTVAAAVAVDAPGGGAPAEATGESSALELASLDTGWGFAEPAAAGQMMPMRGMVHRMMPDLVPPGVEPADLPDPESRGAKLLVRYCWQCHNLPSPSMHAAAEWPGIAERMFDRMDRMSGMMGIESPSPEDRQAITGYLTAHAMASVPEASMPEAGSPSASLFKEFCTQCHALPDPKGHTPSEWGAILEKMKANMKTMNKKVMTAAQRDEILAYLDKNAKRRDD